MRLAAGLVSGSMGGRDSMMRKVRELDVHRVPSSEVNANFLRQSLCNFMNHQRFLRLWGFVLSACFTSLNPNVDFCIHACRASIFVSVREWDNHNWSSKPQSLICIASFMYCLITWGITGWFLLKRRLTANSSHIMIVQHYYSWNSRFIGPLVMYYRLQHCLSLHVSLGVSPHSLLYTLLHLRFRTCRMKDFLSLQERNIYIVCHCPEKHTLQTVSRSFCKIDSSGLSL